MKKWVFAPRPLRIWSILRGHFVQILRYTGSFDARRITILLRSNEPASLVFEQNSSLKRSGTKVAKSGRNHAKVTKNARKVFQNALKMTPKIREIR